MVLQWLAVISVFVVQVLASNSSFTNPMLPGFHPDPSCIFVPEWNETFFCASSSFLVFPGIPIHASKDLQNWKLISNALNRPDQLPDLGTIKRATSGIWASTIRYREGTFYVVTTLVFDDYPKSATNRFENIILTTTNPYSSAAWSQPIHFGFPGYDTSPFWDDDGKVYATGTHAWEVDPGIQMFPLNLTTGEVGETLRIWNGTGASSPEGPHIYKKDGYYYLMVAEGGTGSGHRVSIARSKNITGPYEGDTANPVLTNGNTTRYFQDVGHADLFQDSAGNWWGVALSVRQGPDGSYPMGRETSLTPVTWNEGEWPVFTYVQGNMNGWQLEPKTIVENGEGSLIAADQYLDFSPGSKIPPELVHWRFPHNGSYQISPPANPYSLELSSSVANLSGIDGRSYEPGGQTFIARRQVHSLFTYSATFNASTITMASQEVGVSVFLDQLHHWDLGLVMCSSCSTAYENVSFVNNTTPTPHLRLRGITTVPSFIFPDIAIIPVPMAWLNQSITMQISASNITHYTFSAGPAGMQSQMMDVGFAPGLGLTWGFTGALLGVYATTNGVADVFKTYISDWKYTGVGQVVI